MRKLLIISVFCWGVFSDADAQLKSSDAPVRLPDSFYHNKPIITLLWSDTTAEEAEIKKVLIPRVCKRYDVIYLVVPAEVLPTQDTTVVLFSRSSIQKNVPLLKVTGNILYDVNYRSRIDTPYAENDIYQHTLQTRLDVVYKQEYPFRIYVTTRFSNSNLFRKYTDLNFLFSTADFKRSLKTKALNAVESFISSTTGELDSLKRVINAKRIAIATLSQSLQKPDLSQKLVEEREKALFSKPNTPSVPNASTGIEQLKEPIRLHGEFKFSRSIADSLQSMANDKTDHATINTSKYQAYKDSMEQKREKLDSLTGELEAAEKLYSKLKAVQEFNLGELKKQIQGAKDVNVLVQKLEQLNIPDTVLPKGYKTLSSIQSFSIGRSVADYSELSVKNISITGLQMEYNPRYYYYAVAIGKVDYRFRDYIVSGNPRSHQYVALARFGKGTRNGNHIIFTYYTGKRQFFNSSIALRSNNEVPEYNLAGITLEGFYKINRNISLVGEIAKSTIPYYSKDSLQKRNWMNPVTNFKERSNEAYAVKLFSFFPKTGTRFTGNLRYTGANFQSFSTFTTGASQLRWKGRVEQPFFKKQLTIISSVEQNDYSNPFVTTAYKSSSVLASIQASLRIKKWPLITLGYYPSFQLVKTGDNHYSESRYYTLSGSAGYYYKINAAQLSSYLVYSQFYNEASDSGFVYYNSKNILLSQNIIYSKVSLMMNVSLSTSTDYNMCTIENSGQFTINKLITAGAGVKMIKYSLISALQWGYSGNLILKIPRVGDIQLTMDKGFIPGMNRQLAENKMGRLTYYKTF